VNNAPQPLVTQIPEIAPAIPSKYDIIPIHASDAATFKRCRRRWEWSSPMRMNLTGSVSQLGVYMPLTFGSWIHYALAQYYDPHFQRDPVEAFVSAFDIGWHGGTVHNEADLELSYDPEPRKMLSDLQSGVMWKVRGLWELLPEPLDEDMFEEHKDLGIEMLTFYKEYARKNDNFRVIAAEHTFSVPILDPSTGEVLRAIDPRDGIEKEVHARGTQDAIIQMLDSLLYGILEHKSAVDIGEGYFDKLDKDEQCTRYLWAGQREAQDHGLAYTKLSFVLYNAIRKSYPRPPTELKNGLFSINRTEESTTIELLEKFIQEKGIGIVIANDEKRQAYMNWVREKGDEQFIERRLVTRNQYEIQSCAERVFMEASDMLDPTLRIYPNPTGDWACLRCTFRGPCIAKDDGSDWQTMLKDNYALNRGR
jgi:hypothetical protein